MKINNNGFIYRIRNGITGQYLHESLFKMLEFDNIYAAYKYLKQHELNENIYIVECIK